MPCVLMALQMALLVPVLMSVVWTGPAHAAKKSRQVRRGRIALREVFAEHMSAWHPEGVRVAPPARSDCRPGAIHVFTWVPGWHQPCQSIGLYINGRQVDVGGCSNSPCVCLQPLLV